MDPVVVVDLSRSGGVGVEVRREREGGRAGVGVPTRKRRRAGGGGELFGGGGDVGLSLPLALRLGEERGGLGGCVFVLL